MIDLLSSVPRYNISHIFHFIRTSFDHEIYDGFNRLYQLHNKLAIARGQRNFLLDCRTHDIYPKHIDIAPKPLLHVRFHSRSVNKMSIRFAEYIRRKTLKFEITDINFHINYLNKSINTIKEFFTEQSHELIFTEFTKFIAHNMTHIHTQQKKIHNKKFSKIFTANSTAYDVRHDEICRSVLPDNQFPSYLDATSASDHPADIAEIKNKWIVNISNTSIPREVEEILSLGDLILV